MSEFPFSLCFSFVVRFTRLRGSGGFGDEKREVERWLRGSWEGAVMDC